MVTRFAAWDRTCPACRTTFASVQYLGVCPKCSLRFSVDTDGNVLDEQGRLQEEAGPPHTLSVPADIDERIERLPAEIARRVRSEYPADEQEAILRLLACVPCSDDPREISPRIWHVILDRARGDHAAIEQLVMQAQQDPRDLLW